MICNNTRISSIKYLLYYCGLLFQLSILFQVYCFIYYIFVLKRCTGLYNHRKKIEPLDFDVKCNLIHTLENVYKFSSFTTSIALFSATRLHSGFMIILSENTMRFLCCKFTNNAEQRNAHGSSEMTGPDGLRPSNQSCLTPWTQTIKTDEVSKIKQDVLIKFSLKNQPVVSFIKRLFQPVCRKSKHFINLIKIRYGVFVLVIIYHQSFSMGY